MSHRQGEEMTSTLLAPLDRTMARQSTLISKGKKKRRLDRATRVAVATVAVDPTRLPSESVASRLGLAPPLLDMIP
jgi:hypothetical protein